MKLYIRYCIGLLCVLGSFQVLGNSSKLKQDLIKKYRNEKDNGRALAHLETLVRSLIRSNDKHAYSYLDTLLERASQAGEYDLMARNSRFMAQKYLNERQYDSAEALLKNMLALESKFKIPSSKGHLLLKRGALRFDQERLAEASQDYETAASLFKLSKDSIFQADALYFAGQTQANLKHYVRSVKNYRNAYQLYQALGDDAYATYTLGELASLYDMNGLYEKALAERKKVNIIGFRKGFYRMLATNNINMAGTYFDLDSIENAYQTLIRLESIFDSIPAGPERQASGLYLPLKKARYHLLKQQPEIAKSLLDSARYRWKSSSLPDFYETDLLLAEAIFYDQKGQKQKALEKLERVNSKEFIYDPKLRMAAHKHTAELLKGRQPKKALKHMAEYVHLRDSVFSRQQTQAFLFLQSEFELERKEHEIESQGQRILLLKKEGQLKDAKRNQMLILFLSLSLLGVGSSATLYARHKRRRRALQIDLRRKQQELEAYTEQLLQKSQEKELLASELEKWKETEQGDTHLDTLNELIHSKILTAEDWEEFKRKFESVHPNFFTLLQQSELRLTKAEERLLALEKLSIKPTDIANMLGISHNSVLTSRYRLRKKLEAPAEVPLVEFIEDDLSIRTDHTTP
ncbi:hypothetical protein FUAX_42120 (plasmid) [Fulvitalea axinellae]|uniref:HTH luxR-type domain-containing protein n=1 Tax=Fulvitalea axinellae TaxID=1182444 RepID=A0AAU9CQW6_9BACT|nr:hypothetical protein FUAX_42120 [Fulvitalea axinellae]